MKVKIKFKKILAFFFLISGLIVLLLFNTKTIQKKPEFFIDNQIEPTKVLAKNSFQVKSNLSENEYQVNWIVIGDKGTLELFSNLEEKKSSKEQKEKQNCQFLVNAGFFTESHTHIGLFVTDSKIISESYESNLFNGYFSINTNGMPSITRSPPFLAKIALQAGPILIKDKIPQNLKIKNRNFARRAVVAVDKDDKIIFLIIYDPENLVSGPGLEELPEILTEVEKKINLDFKDALNLDGGSHSAFLTDEIALTEISPIGSFFCIKK